MSSHQIPPKKNQISQHFTRFACGLGLVIFGECSATIRAAEAPLPVSELKRMSLQELMEQDVTSVSRQPQPYVHAPAALQVITGDEIRRSGASSIPEALRLADHLHVAQKNSHDWAISARGFNTDLANKLLVLVDGRTVYTPLFSGVLWDRQDYLLEDIERIEVISGPGSTLWGANAVNGVINIITKSAKDTQGLYLEAGGGTYLRAFTGVRYGAMVSSNVSLRVYGKYFNRDDQVFPNGDEASDRWWMAQGGFRMDAEMSYENTFTLQGDYYGGEENLSTGGRSEVSGGNVLGRWTHRFSEESDMILQLYYDRTHLDIPVPPSLADGGVQLAPAGRLQDDLDTYDMDFQHRFPLGERNRVVWGLGYRFTHNVVENAPGLAFLPEELDRHLFSGFLQDQITLHEKVILTLGTKIEHNGYTGFEFEPSGRLQWNATEKQMVWAAISRAVRMPSRVDRHQYLPTPDFAPFVENLLAGNGDFKSETVIAYELGYRAQISESVSASISGFYNEYDDVRSTSLSPPDPIFELPFPLFYENNLEGETYGIELTLQYQVFDWWRLRGGYTWLQEDIRVKDGEFDFNNALNETADPKHRFSLRSSMDLPGNVGLDAGLRWVDSFRYNNAGTANRVSSYFELDARLSWQATENLEFAVVGQNLLHRHHSEYVISSPNPRENIERSVYGKVTFRW